MPCFDGKVKPASSLSPSFCQSLSRLPKHEVTTEETTKQQTNKNNENMYFTPG